MNETITMILLVVILVITFAAVFLIGNYIGERKYKEKTIKELREQKQENIEFIEEMLDSIERSLAQYSNISKKILQETIQRYKESVNDKK
jgi:hypothetical protein